MGWKKTGAWVLGVIALVLFGFWAAPRLFPGLGWGLNELNQVAGIASLAVAVATLVVSLWPTRPSPTGSTGQSPPPPGGVANTITGDTSGTTVQAHTIHDGIGNTTHTGDHIDFSGGTFNSPVTGKHEEHHHDPRPPSGMDGR